MKKSYKIYGIDGRRQRMSFSNSMNFVDCRNAKIELITADKLNTHDYVIMSVEADTAEQIEKALNGQITDGIFENSRVGKIEEIKA